MAIVIEFPRPELDAPPDAEIIDLLASYLERARRGEVQSLVLIAAGGSGHPECAMQLNRAHAVNVIGTLRVAEGKIGSALNEVTEQ